MFKFFTSTFTVLVFVVNISLGALIPVNCSNFDQESLLSNKCDTASSSYARNLEILQRINLSDVGSDSSDDESSPFANQDRMVDASSTNNISCVKLTMSVAIPLLVLGVLFTLIMLQDRFSNNCCDKNGHFDPNKTDWTCEHLPHSHSDFIRFWCPND